MRVKVLIHCCLALWTWNLALGCMWMQTQLKGSKSRFKMLNSICITTLEEVGGEVIPGGNIPPFPENLYAQAEQLQGEECIEFIHETLEDIKLLYKSIYDVAPEKLKQPLLLLLSGIHRQTTELEQCIQSTESSPPSHSVRRLNWKMKEHFRRLYDHLKNEEYGADSWETIRGAVLEHLRSLELLAIQTAM